MRISRLPFIAVAGAMLVALLSGVGPVDAASRQSHAKRQRAKRGSICGNPKVACKTTVPFQPHDLPFQVPANSVIFDTELFYAVMLKSVKTRRRRLQRCLFRKQSGWKRRLYFPSAKFSRPDVYDIENLFYSTISANVRIMAVYAGTTLPEARRCLSRGGDGKISRRLHQTDAHRFQRYLSIGRTPPVFA